MNENVPTGFGIFFISAFNLMAMKHFDSPPQIDHQQNPENPVLIPHFAVDTHGPARTI